MSHLFFDIHHQINIPLKNRVKVRKDNEQFIHETP